MHMLLMGSHVGAVREAEGVKIYFDAISTGEQSPSLIWCCSSAARAPFLMFTVRCLLCRCPRGSGCVMAVALPLPCMCHLPCPLHDAADSAVLVGNADGRTPQMPVQLMWQLRGGTQCGN